MGKRTATKNGLEYVVVRTYSAGVHVGELVSRTGSEVTLANASRVWRWKGSNSLHELALHGAAEECTRISERVTRIDVLGVIEVIPCSGEARKSLERPRWGT